MSEQEDVETGSKKKQGKAVMEYVKELLRWGRLAQVGDIIYTKLDDIPGWSDVTHLVMRRAADSSSKCPRRAGIMSALYPFIAVPAANAEVCTPYCEYQFAPQDAGKEDADRFEGPVHESHWRPKQIATTAVVFDDGMYDAKSGKFVKWNNDDVFGPSLSLTYKEVTKAQDTERYKEFIDGILSALPDPETLWYFQKVMSGVLQPHVPQKMGIFFCGPAGARKTTIATAILCAPAGYAGMSIESIDDLAKDKFAQANLIGKFANLSDDPDGMTDKLTAWFKRFTGSSIQRGEFKYVQARNYPITAKLVVCCNTFPRMGDASDAVWNRLQVFNFARAGDAAKKYETGTTENVKLGVPYWSDRATRACITGWLLRGLEARIREGLTPPKQVRDWAMEAAALSDPLRGSLVSIFRRTDDPQAFISTQEVLDILQSEHIRTTGPVVASYMESVFKSPVKTRNVTQPDGSVKQVRGYEYVSRK